MRWSQRLFAPWITLLNGSGVFLLKLLGVTPTGHRHVHSPDEIELLIAESRDGGLLEPQEQVRLHQALRLGLRTARELMVPRDRLAAVDASTPFTEVLRVVATSPYSRLPVYRDRLDDIIGILHTKDVVTEFVSARNRASLATLLRAIPRVHDSIPADQLLAHFRERRIHQALVVNDTGAVAGLITLEDIFAELLGGVSDEFKVAPARPILLPDGSVRLPGAMRVDQAAQFLGTDWKSPGDTLATFVNRINGGVPAPGEQLTIGRVDVVVEAVEGDLVSSLLALPPDHDQ